VERVRTETITAGVVINRARRLSTRRYEPVAIACLGMITLLLRRSAERVVLRRLFHSLLVTRYSVLVLVIITCHSLLIYSERILCDSSSRLFVWA